MEGVADLHVAVVSLQKYPKSYAREFTHTRMDFPLKTHFQATPECSISPTSVLLTLYLAH